MRVKISLPKQFKYGGQDSSGALTLNKPFYSSTGLGDNSNPFAVSNTLSPVPRELASIEAEKGETAVVPQSDGSIGHFNIVGKRHSEGGTPLAPPPQSFIYSDTKKMTIKNPEVLKHFGKSSKATPAKIAKPYDLNTYQAMLDNDSTDPLTRKTAKMMVANNTKKLQELAEIQEMQKGFPSGIPQISGEQGQVMARYGGVTEFKAGGPSAIPTNRLPPFVEPSLVPITGMYNTHDQRNHVMEQGPDGKMYQKIDMGGHKPYSMDPVFMDNASRKEYEWNGFMPVEKTDKMNPYPLPEYVPLTQPKEEKEPYGSKRKPIVPSFQDMLGLSGMVSRDVAPIKQQYNPHTPRPVYVDSSRGIAAIQEQSNSQSLANSLFGDGPATRATNAAGQGQALSQIANYMASIAGQNAQIANTSAGQNAQIYNQGQLQNIELASKYNNEMANFQQNKTRENMSKMQAIKQAYDNASKMNALNDDTANPFMIDWMGRSILKPGYDSNGRLMSNSSTDTSPGSQYAAMAADLRKNTTMNDDQIHEYIMKWVHPDYTIQSKDAKGRQSTKSKVYAKPKEQYGGYVPTNIFGK